MDTALTIAADRGRDVQRPRLCNAGSVHVVGRNGEVIVALRGDNASPHTFENSLRGKAFTSRTFRASRPASTPSALSSQGGTARCS